MLIENCKYCGKEFNKRGMGTHEKMCSKHYHGILKEGTINIPPMHEEELNMMTAIPSKELNVIGFNNPVEQSYNDEVYVRGTAEVANYTDDNNVNEVAKSMNSLVLVSSVEKSSVVIVNLDHVIEIAPLKGGGCVFFMVDGKTMNVKESFAYFSKMVIPVP